MRIGLIIYGSLDTVSGGYLYDRMLVRQLRKQGDEVIILSLPWRNYTRHLGAQLHLKLVHTWRALDLDILLEDELNHPSLFWLNRSLQRVLHTPLISIVHHLRMHEEHPTFFNRLYQRVETSYLNGVDGFVYNSETTRKSVSRILKRPVPGIVGFPAADHIEPPAQAAARQILRRRSHEPGPLRVLAVGNVIERKNIHTLLTALFRLPVDDLTLTVVGSLTTDPAYVELLAMQLELVNLHPDQITFTGSVDDETMRHYYAQSHVMALPSYEGFGIVYLEAMGFGCVPIASNSGAAHEIINDGVNGFLVAPTDATSLAANIALLHADRNQLETMGFAARVCYECHPTWAETMNAASIWLHEEMKVQE